MAKVLKTIRDSDMMIVTFDHPSESTIPGQTVNINGRFFAISESTESSVSVLTRYGGPLDLPEGTEVNMAGPLGKGFPGYDSWDAVIVCGGTATGVGFNLLKYRIERGLRTWFVSYTRGGNPYAKVIDELSSSKSVEKCLNWNTRELDRPSSPYSPLCDSKFPVGANVFVAGPKELLEACHSSAEQFGIDRNNIHLNY